ncbi:MAG: hypothetical protein JW730_12345 [Anaerolineales bacterium]|nr:hypothetical protein [Anaerolineales bacterium]
MKRWIPKKITLVLFVTLLTMVTGCGQPARIEGRILRSDTNESIDSVIVDLWTLSQLTGEPYLATSAKTNDEGRFIFEVTPGTYRLIFGLKYNDSNESPCLSTKKFRDDGWRITTESMLSGGYLLIAENKAFVLQKGDVWNQDIDISCE